MIALMIVERKVKKSSGFFFYLWKAAVWRKTTNYNRWNSSE